MAESHRLVVPREIMVKDLNENITCKLCGGYFIDATVLIDCSHTFCRACIVRYFESSRYCPNCGAMVHKSKPLSKLRSDQTLQSLIYKVVPFLYSKEIQRRADFYHSTSFRATSSCSDDSVLGDRTQDSEEWRLANIGDPQLYLSPDDSISLSVEYYRGPVKEEPKPNLEITAKLDSKVISDSNSVTDKQISGTNASDNSAVVVDSIKKDSSETTDLDKFVFDDAIFEKRFLKSPAAVKVLHLMKFIQKKFALTEKHKIDIIYDDEVLPSYLSLMDVTYTFNCGRDEPLRFFYIIYIPRVEPELEKLLPIADIPEIKIEPSVTNEPDQNSLVVCSNSVIKPETEETKLVEANNNLKQPVVIVPDDESSDPIITDPSPEKPQKYFDYKIRDDGKGSAESCIFDYTAEPDKDEIKAFAERRDREWALQKHSDQEVHVSKKRKKNKHAKNEFMHKKRKLHTVHAEITPNEVTSKSDDSLKLKVKLSKLNVSNGHKHKHRSSSNSSVESKSYELSPKERLLQMRQVRHKNIPPVEDKTESIKTPEISETPEPPPKPVEPPADQIPMSKTLRSDFSIKTSITKDIGTKLVRINLEKCPENKIAAAKRGTYGNMFVKSIEKLPKPAETTTESKPELKITETKPEIKSEVKPIEKLVLKNVPFDESKSIENKLNNIDFKNNQSIVTKNFTVSKVETGTKRKLEPQESTKDKRPSLEITVINVVSLPTPTSVTQTTVQTKPITQPKTVNSSVTKTNLTQNKLSVPQMKANTTTMKTLPPNLKPTNINTKPIMSQPKPNIIPIKPINKPLIIPQTKPQTTPQTKPQTTPPTKPQTTPPTKPQIKPQTTPQTKSQTTPQTKSQTTPQTSPPTKPQTKSSTSDGPPAKKRPPPLTIPLGRIKEMNQKSLQKPPEKCDIFGALDLSAKPNKPELKPIEFRSNSSSPKLKLTDQIRPKTPLKLETKDVLKQPAKSPEKRPNMSNLQMLSESAVQILMAKNSKTPIPNLIKKIPNSLLPSTSGLKSDFIHKPPNLIPKTPNLIPKITPITGKPPNFIQKPPNFVSKNIPKLNEINKNQFSRLGGNVSAMRNVRPAGQNQSIRNIPNPSLLVRQQNQNRINSMVTTTSTTVNNSIPDSAKINKIMSPPSTTTNKSNLSAADLGEMTEKKPEGKTSEPPPLKPIDSFKK